MKIIQRNSLRRGGFAGLRETRLVMNPKVFRDQTETGTSAGIGRFIYLADASFLPNGDTRMHSHREVDVVSIMLEGRILHEDPDQGSQELGAGAIQVQRAGSEGFSHNEINPDPAKNRVVQIWLKPESPEQPGDCRVFEARDNGRTRVYGGASGQADVIPAKTVVDVVRLKSGESVEQNGRSIAYVMTGNGTVGGDDLGEGDLVETRNFKFHSEKNSQLILAYES